MTTRPRLTRPPRILIASDQNHALRDVEGSLGRQGSSVLRVFAGTAVLARARAACPDMILLDAKLADSESLDLSRLLRADPLIGASTPILLLVHERPKREDHLNALRAGVWELLRQPVDPGALLGKLEAYLAAKLEAERAPKRSLVDELTGLHTRRGLARRAWELILQSAHHNTSVACVVVAPEVRGEPDAGVLRDVARLVRSTARHSDAAGRVGLTEFAGHEIDAVAALVDRQRPRSAPRRYVGDHVERVGTVLVHHRQRAVAVGREREPGGGVERRAVHARSDRERRDQLARRRIRDRHDLVAADAEQAVVRAIDGQAGRGFARRERPAACDAQGPGGELGDLAPVFDVDLHPAVPP